MSFSNKGVYSPASGATTAASGQTIASATWNAIFTDLTTALTLLGELTFYNAVAVAVPISITADTQISVVLPPGATNYAISNVRLANSVGTTTSTTVGLYTAANQGGTTIITSTALTIASSLANAANSHQVITPASTNTVMFNASVLYFCVVHNNGGSAATVDAIVNIIPLP